MEPFGVVVHGMLEYPLLARTVAIIGAGPLGTMEEHQKAELSSRLCLSGPHKDDLVLSIGGREARTYSSQGQTRTAALALKLAEREIYKNASGEYPVLLLDDVLSELDPKRQDFVLCRIPGGQVLITCCEEDRLPCLPDARLLRVEGGRVLV